ncbi:MAG: creatininase family protein [Thermoproteota archaeon]|nr:creatininase family protein [Candidatus Brockarchaeota archaeon]
MLWEKMTSPEIEDAANKGLVAILPIGSIEIHGPHMPVGTDSITVYKVAELAAEKEPAIVLPPFYYAYVPENRHFPGTVSLTAKTLLSLLEEVCDEISRNGFKKILIVNGHGGNNELIRVFLRDSLTKRKNYFIYALVSPWPPNVARTVAELSEGRTIGHACEIETSVGLYLFEDLVKTKNITQEARTGSLNLPKGIETPVDWQAYALQLYLGDPRFASKEKGKVVIDELVNFLAEVIRKVKEDENVPRTISNFYERAYKDTKI